MSCLYSEKSLNLQAPGVREIDGHSPDAAYRFRYEGLKLVPQSGNQYLFLPAGIQPAGRSANRAVLTCGHPQRFRFWRAGAQARSVNEALSRCCRKAKRFFAAAGSGDGAPTVSGRSRRSRAGATVARLRQ